MRSIVMLLAPISITSQICAAQSESPRLEPQVSGVTAVLQAVSAISDSVAWIGGHAGIVLRTVNGGATWHRIPMPGADTLQFRDVHAVSRDTAFVLSAGTGSRSRIYRTTDGGKSWRLQFRNADTAAFYDCFDFWDAGHGVVVGDAVRGRMVLRLTENGADWRLVPPTRIPAALEGEGAFAASGTCVVRGGARQAWFGTGAGGRARVYRTADRGGSWAVATVPLEAGGVFTLAFCDSLRGLALGGDLDQPAASTDNVAGTNDGGRTWERRTRVPFAGVVYGAACVPGRGPLVLAVGPHGAAWTRDAGSTWSVLEGQGYWAVGFGSERVGWMVGGGGQIVRVVMR